MSDEDTRHGAETRRHQQKLTSDLVAASVLASVEAIHNGHGRQIVDSHDPNFRFVIEVQRERHYDGDGEAPGLTNDYF